MSAADQHRTIRFLMFEVWEDGGGEFPLFITSDGSEARRHQRNYPDDTITKRYWLREGMEVTR